MDACHLQRPHPTSLLVSFHRNHSCSLICPSFPFSYALLEGRDFVLLIFLFLAAITILERKQREWWGQNQVENEKEESKREDQR